MPSSHLTSTKPVSDISRFPRCLQHPEEELKFFCDTHDTTCCMACTVVLHNQHNQCTVVYIPDVAKDYKTGPEYKQLTAELNKTHQLAAKYLSDIEEKMKKVDQLKTEETAKLEQYRTELKEFVDKQIDELTSKVEQLRDTDMGLLKDKRIKTKKMISTVGTNKTKLQACEQTPVELFIESRRTRHEVVKFQVDFVNIAKTKYQVYWVHKDDQMKAVLKNKAGLATIEMGKA